MQQTDSTRHFRLATGMRRLAVACPLLLATIAAVAQDSTGTVEGTGDAARDVAAVQAAVDRGGTVVLKGTFDFGETGSVSIRRDVEIMGDLSSSQPTTRIKGGRWSFHSPLPASLPVPAPGPAITIRGIHFDGAAMGPVQLSYARHVVVSDNRITAVKPLPSPQPILGRDGLLLQHGIALGPFLSFPGADPANALTGEVKVERNFIDLLGTHPDNTLGQGIFLAWGTGVRASIVENTVLNASRNGIEALDNHPGSQGEGFVLVRSNHVTTPVNGLAFPGLSFPNAIITGWFLDPAGGADPARRMKHVITDNLIRARGQTSMGIAVLTDEAVVANNNITCQGKASRGIVLFGSSATVLGNRIQGSGAAAIAFSTGVKPMLGSRNVVSGNDLTAYRPASGALQAEEGTQGNLVLE